MAEALEALFQRHLSSELTYRLIQFNGLATLLQRLPERLQAYRSWIPAEYRIVVLIDRDREDCHVRKNILEQAARNAGFATKAAPEPSGAFQVISRIAIEELESWFFGDVPALCAAFPGVPASLGEKRPYRDPDAIRGGTAQALLRVLQEAGHYSGLQILPKLEVARRVAEYMTPATNRSRSFQVFWNAVTQL